MVVAEAQWGREQAVPVAKWQHTRLAFRKRFGLDSYIWLGSIYWVPIQIFNV